VPLKHLIQDNPVKESPEAEPEQYPGGVWEFSIFAAHRGPYKTPSGYPANGQYPTC
jgi:hypothetical protein